MTPPPKTKQQQPMKSLHQEDVDNIPLLRKGAFVHFSATFSVYIDGRRIDSLTQIDGRMKIGLFPKRK